MKDTVQLFEWVDSENGKELEDVGFVHHDGEHYRTPNGVIVLIWDAETDPITGRVYSIKPAWEIYS